MTEVATPTVPDDLAELDDEALAELLTELETGFDQLHDEGSRDIVALTDLADQIDRLRAEQTEREQQAAELDEQVAALADRVHPPDPDDGADASAEQPDDTGDESDDEPDETGDPVGEAQPELVTAAATPARPARPNLGAVARRAPRNQPQPRRPDLVVTAAADLPGVSPGSRLDRDRLAQLMHDRARSLSDHSGRIPIATVEIPYGSAPLGRDGPTNTRIINEVIGRSDAAALVASGGWCAPSEPIFEFFDAGPDTDGLFDLPSLGTSVRGGVMVPQWFSANDIDSATDFWTWTEEDDEAATADPPPKTKTCIRIPCPTWHECRLEAAGLCVTHGNLTDRAWPELTSYYLGVAMGTFAHYMSAQKLQKVLDTLQTVTLDASMSNSDAAGDLLGAIELMAIDQRRRFRLSRTRTLECILPDWTVAMLRADVAKRAGDVDMLSVTDAEVVGWLTSRGIRPQFVADYQPIDSANAPAVGWPDTISFAMYQSGSYVQIDGGSIDLGVQRDSTLNATNDHTAAWFEQFYQVCRIGPPGIQVEVPIDVDGVTACCPTTTA